MADLLPHPGLVKYARGYSTQELSTLSDRGESVYADPITITHENVILEGYAVWQLAKLQNRATLTCIVRHMDHEESLLHLLDRNRGSKGLGDYVRILMALELEPWFKERAKSNQRVGGREKGSTQLAEADRLDVRIEIARAAGVSAGNISKVKKILQSATPELQSALCAGEIKINRGAVWAKSAASTQLQYLANHRTERGVRRTINILLRKHEVRHPHICEGLREIQRGLTKLHADTCLFPLSSALYGVLREVDSLLGRSERRDGAA